MKPSKRWLMVTLETDDEKAAILAARNAHAKYVFDAKLGKIATIVTTHEGSRLLTTPDIDPELVRVLDHGESWGLSRWEVRVGRENVYNTDVEALAEAKARSLRENIEIGVSHE